MSGAALPAGPTPYPAQQRASEPGRSVWVAASAGSGKTKVLADRVLRLMLAGSAPERILCLTFTRAAAAEMSNRINELLGQWAAAADADLERSIAGLTGTPTDDATRARARRLFARVLEVPGGLKIQTIHAFCQSLLGRFPLEAGIAPHFEAMDERSAAEAMHAARDEVLMAAAADPDGALARALAEVTHWLNEDAFAELMSELGRERGRIARLLERTGGIDGYGRAVDALLGLAEGETPEGVLAGGCADGAFDAAALRRAATALATGSDADANRGQAIGRWLEASPVERTRDDDYVRSFLTAEGAIRKTLCTKPVAERDPAVPDALAAEAARLMNLDRRVNAARIAGATRAVMRLAATLLDAYTAEKARSARLDYDDLILHVRRLLETSGAAAWVLYKLDGGLDHILIDEAQDTNPDQWAIVRAIAEEFFVGEGAREAAGDGSRTVFAVGDAKQSIFSFQRADPDEFHRMNAYFADRVRRAGESWDQVELDVSFRSTPAVLAAVDAVFEDDQARDGLGEARVGHTAHRRGQAGLVELWPTVKPEPRVSADAWNPPPTQINAGLAPPARLAAVIAHRIDGWIASGERLESRGRPARAGDFLILVQRRTAFVDDVVRGLKDLGIGVAGVDRLVLSEHIAVMDLIALGEFLLLPEDDLILATVLKGPLIGFDEEALFALAHGRGERSLWRALRDRARRDPGCAAAHELLSTLLSRVDRVSPFDLYAELLGPRRGREAMVARLGIDANDPVDEFLALAMAHQRAHPPSLQGFLRWFQEGRTDIKRDLERAERDEVRIMTVHGAKGLQAPVVILADTTRTPRQAASGRAPLLWHSDGPSASPMMLWRPRAGLHEPVTAAIQDEARRRRDQEYRRLLYVAMTRAEDRLYVAGYETAPMARNGPPADCWYAMARRGLARLAAAREIDLTVLAAPELGWTGEGFRFVTAQHDPPDKRDEGAAGSPAAAALPDWAGRAAPAEPVPPAPLAPSRPTEEEPAMLSPIAEDGGRRFERGLIVHALLQHLPDLPPAERRRAAETFLARPAHGLDAAARAALADEVLAVIEAAAVADLFGPESRAEVPVVGYIGESVVSGRIDRLVVRDDTVKIVDFKTNRPPPDRIDAVPSLYLRQMAAYRAILTRIYPEKTVDCAILWTVGPVLMSIPTALLDPHAP